MDAFVEAGGNFIDTADIYSRWVDGNPGGVSEEVIGRWVQERGTRDEVVLATKVRGRMWDGPNGEGLSRSHIIQACEDSLRRLQTDYIDLYQTHWFDVDTPIEETMQTLDDLVSQGKVRYIGCSNMPAWRLMQALWCSDRFGLARFVSLQPHYNLAHRSEFERELKEVVEEYEVGAIPYSPLAGGFLTGKYRPESAPKSARAAGVRHRYFTDAGWRVLDAVLSVSADLGAEPAAVALAWLLAQPSVVAPIVGANSVAQLQQSLAATELTLDCPQLDALDQASAWQA
jgi:aryl-alcohol dehydrogenase-like predicted oxidoreductase